MNYHLLKLALSITLFANNLYASNPVSETKNDITVAVQVLSSRECKTLFGQDMRSSRMYPIRLFLRNQSNSPISVSIREVQVRGANIVTKASIQSSISTMYIAGCVFLFIFFPFTFLIHYSIKHLTELLSIVAKHGFTDQMVIIQPGALFETFAFPEYRLPETEYARDANGNRLLDEHGKELPGKTPPFVAPQFVETAVTFSTSTAWFNFTIELSAPV